MNSSIQYEYLLCHCLVFLDLGFRFNEFIV